MPAAVEPVINKCYKLKVLKVKKKKSQLNKDDIRKRKITDRSSEIIEVQMWLAQCNQAAFALITAADRLHSQLPANTAKPA